MGDSIARRLSSRQNRDRHLKQLRKLLSLADKPSALEAFWIIDGARNAHHFVKPSSSTFPDEFLFAKFGEPGAIYPWELEALVIELLAVERTQEARRELNLQSWGAISKLVNHVRAIENAESGMREPGIIMRELTRILNRQLPWQMHNWNAADSVRWWSIFQSSVLQEIFVANVGVRLKTFIQLGMAWSLDLDTSPFVKHPGAAPELGITKTDASNLVRAISLPAQTATAKVKAAVRDGQELAYRHSFLRERPVIALARNGKPVFIRPLHQLLVWRLTSGLYLDVIGDPRAANEIGKGFEDYVLRLCRAGLPDVEIQGAFDFGPKGRRRQTVDCLLHRQQRVEVLIECKAKRVPLAVKHELEETAARNAAIDELAKGMVQLCRTEEALRSGHVADWSIVDQPTLLLVTLDDWIFVGADIREEIEVAARPIAVARGLNPDALREIALCTATELDQLISTFEYSTIRLIARESRTQPYRHHQVSSVGRELFRGGRRTRPAYPLADELDSLIGLADLEGGRAPKVILGSSLG